MGQKCQSILIGAEHFGEAILVSGFLQLAGFLLVVAYSVILGAIAFAILNGASGLEAIVRFSINHFNIEPNALALGALGLAWLVGVVPGFILMANGLNLELQSEQRVDQKAAKTSSDELLKEIAALRAATEKTHSVLEEAFQAQSTQEQKRGLF